MQHDAIKDAIYELTHVLRGMGALQEINNKLDKIMSQISDFAAAVQTSFDKVNTDLDNITTGIAALDTLITNFQNSPGTLSAIDQAALDAIQKASQALVTKADAINVVAPTPPVTNS